jgi:excisionase family DNA binding protein
VLIVADDLAKVFGRFAGFEVYRYMRPPSPSPAQGEWPDRAGPQTNDAASREASSSTLDELMTAQQVAALLLLPISTVMDYARRGVLPSIKLGKHRRFVRSQVERAIVELARGSR